MRNSGIADADVHSGPATRVLIETDAMQTGGDHKLYLVVLAIPPLLLLMVQFFAWLIGISGVS